MVEFPKFRGFAEETKLHGIPRMTAGSKLSIAFWTVLVTICVCMATKDQFDLATLYLSQPTAIRMSLTQLTMSHNWTTPTLCMDIVPQYITDEVDVSLSDHMATNPVTFDDPEAFAGEISVFLSQVKTANYTENQVQGDREILKNLNMLYYSFMMLGYLTRLEQTLMDQDTSNDDKFIFGSQDPLADERSQLFYDEFQRQNVSMATLQQLVGTWFCLLQLGAMDEHWNTNPQIYGNMENYRYFGDPEYIKLPMCKSNMVTHLGFGMVCSKLFETDYVPLKPNFDYFVIYDTRLTLPLVERDAAEADSEVHNTKNIRFVPNLQFHLDLQGRNVIPSDDLTNIFSWSPADHVVVDIFVSAEYQFLNTKKRRCSSSQISQADCIWQKRVEFVHQTCGCWPSLADIRNLDIGVSCTSNNISDTYNIHNISIDEFCPNMIMSNGPDISDCLVDCHLRNYTFTKHKSTVFPYDLNHARTNSRLSYSEVGSFEFRFGSTAHSLVTEYATTDSFSFMGAFGGSIGTWLGASLLAFAHVPVYIFNHFCLSRCRANGRVVVHSE